MRDGGGLPLPYLAFGSALPFSKVASAPNFATICFFVFRPVCSITKVGTPSCASVGDPLSEFGSRRGLPPQYADATLASLARRLRTWAFSSWSMRAERMSEIAREIPAEARSTTLSTAWRMTSAALGRLESSGHGGSWVRCHGVWATDSSSCSITTPRLGNWRTTFEPAGTMMSGQKIEPTGRSTMVRGPAPSRHPLRHHRRRPALARTGRRQDQARCRPALPLDEGPGHRRHGACYPATPKPKSHLSQAHLARPRPANGSARADEVHSSTGC